MPPATVYLTVNVPVTPAPTLGSVHGVPGKPVQVHPAGGVIERNVVLDGVASVNVAPVIADVPVFVTTCVYVMTFPAWTGFGEATFVTERFGPVPPTIVVAVALLFAEFGSVADEATETAFVIAVPFATPVFTFTTIVKVPEVDPAMFVSVQLTLPVPPTIGVMQLHPAGALREMKVVLAGIVVTRVALSAALGPVFVTT